MQPIRALAARARSYFQEKRGRRGSIVNRSVGGQFRRQLSALEAVVDKTERSYVRCLKPNDSLRPAEFDEER